MWNLTGDDIQRAKGQLQEQRAALQAHYDSEVNRLDGELADIERVERFAANLISNHKEDAPSTPAVDPVPTMRDAAPPTDAVSEQAPVAEAAPADEKSSSRWRMRLSAGEATP
jgi:hypothetical protein